MATIGIYSTARADATNLLKSFVPCLNQLPDMDAIFLDIEQFWKNGLAKNIDCFVLFGILHGPGHVYKECQRKQIDFIYLDHAYFKPGYERGWLRATKNHHTMSRLEPASAERWQKYFAADYPLSEWQTAQRDDSGNILVLPPSAATAWLFDAHDWLDRTIEEITKKTNRPIKIRRKPQEPTVDKNGIFTGLVTHPSDATSLEDDLNNAYCVVSFNSNTTIEATRRGIPIITTNANACYPISFDIEHLEEPELCSEPNRLEMFHWLASNQFYFTELQNGYAWRQLFNLNDN